MSARKASNPGQQLPPARIAPLGSLNAYTVYEHELDQIAAGSPATLALTFSIALLSIAVTLVVAMLTTTIASDRVFYGFLIVLVLCLLVGLILMGYWWQSHERVKVKVAEIKRRMPPLPGTQEAITTDEAG